ncbi:MAG TPA: alpha/beta fold hydrolase [Kofleriaceae bacterium]
MSEPSANVTGRSASLPATWCLFCLPYAGGGASIYRTWSKSLPAGIEVIPVRLAGREDRINEPPCDRLDELVASLVRAVIPARQGRVALFGCSMGALIAFELARELRRRGRAIDHLVVAAAPAPHIPQQRERVRELSDASVLDRVRRLGGTCEAVLENRELMAMLLPTFRADFAILDDYRYKHEPPLACPITAFGGTSDPLVSPEQLDMWRAATTGRFASHLFATGHFFVHSHERALLRQIVTALCTPADSIAGCPPGLASVLATMRIPAESGGSW